MVKRCTWVSDSPSMQDYHDEEWGRPEHNPQKLFELLSLETYQAGLSWQTVLNKRAAFKTAFYDYDLAKVAAMTPADIERLLTNAAIIRNRRKLEATVANAQAILTWDDPADFASWLWAFVDGQPIRHTIHSMADLPATTDLSKQVARELKKKGFKFVGPATVYSFLEAAGLINDHELSCDWAPEKQ
ncbi:DNA-3-methyladenine glycosylase I [Levilactobacillus humaensis]|uniref:DNA-3-methyladenine glycosylase I n=1 Tax=Levilactobacillus humaensis TaxID=2950375 RepID=UPI0021C3A638|nr:DNA-3-methyladenine glycosylase I [Levilactobacillus humaensis]